jgi:hypothetical protein
LQNLADEILTGKLQPGFKEILEYHGLIGCGTSSDLHSGMYEIFCQILIK